MSKTNGLIYSVIKERIRNDTKMSNAVSPVFSQDGKILTWHGVDVQLRFGSQLHLGGLAGETELLESATLIEQSALMIAATPNGHDMKAIQRFVSGYFQIDRETSWCSTNPTNLHTRLVLHNLGKEAIRVSSLVPVFINTSDDMRIGQAGCGSWCLFRQGRQKNDLPSVSILGKQDAASDDPLMAMEEDGHTVAGSQRDDNTTINSDELTVICTGNGEGPGTLLVGYLSTRAQLASVELRLEDKCVVRLSVACAADNSVLFPGGSLASEWIRLDCNPDPFDAIDQYIQARISMNEHGLVRGNPSVYCTWYYYGETITEQDVRTNLDALTKYSLPVDVFQIDEGWEYRFGDWRPNAKFPSGMKALASEIIRHGFRPGIWTCPFIIEPRCEIQYYHCEWLLKHADGSPVQFKANQMDNYVLDTTHPEVLVWLEQLFRELTEGWGFTYHKIDFTRAVAMTDDVVFNQAGCTRAMAYRQGIEAVRRGAGPHAEIIVCGGLYGPAEGLVQGHRTGSDVFSVWPRSEGSKDRSYAPLTIRQNVLRYWMNSLWCNDPDALMVRRKKVMSRNLDLSLGSLTDDEACIFALNQYFGGGIVSWTENLAEIDYDRLYLLRHIMPSVGKSAIPRDLFAGNGLPSVFDTEITPVFQEHSPWHTLARVNWSSEPIEYRFVLDERSLGTFASTAKTFTVAEFWSGRIWSGVEYGEIVDIGTVAPHSAVLLKVTPELHGLPALIYTDGHFSMGGKEISSWEYRQGRLSIGIDWKWACPMKLVIHAPQGRKWTASKGCIGCSVRVEAGSAVIQTAGKLASVIELDTIN